MNWQLNWQRFSTSDFSLHRKAWDSLNQKGANSALLESRFVASLLEHFGIGNEWLLIAGEPEAPVAMGIFSKAKFAVWSTFQPSQAPVGLWVHAADFPLEKLLGSLSAYLPTPTLLIGISQQDPLFSARPADNEHISTIDYIQTAHINIDQSFEEYWLSRGKNLRHNLKRQRNRLEREGISTRLEVLNQPSDMVKSIHQYGELESSGWKSQGGSAIHSDNVQGQFYIDVLSAYAKTGQGRVYRYYYNDRLVASDLCILNHDTLIILKTTYDETIEGTSPAMLMRQDAFQSLFDETALQRIEFYGKVMDWHTKWSDNFRVMYHVNYYPWSIFKSLKLLSSLASGQMSGGTKKQD